MSPLATAKAAAAPAQLHGVVKLTLRSLTAAPSRRPLGGGHELVHRALVSRSPPFSRRSLRRAGPGWTSSSSHGVVAQAGHVDHEPIPDITREHPLVSFI